MGDFDRSGKWLLQHHGDALLHLIGITGVVTWRALQAEVVQPAQLPDGLIEATIGDAAEPDLFVFELATYPERRLSEQLLRDLALVLLDRRRLPEVVTIVLHPKGQFNAPLGCELSSKLGLTQLTASWRVVELWNVSAEDLLRQEDPGLVPWVPLCSFSGAPETLFRRCREVIDQRAVAAERETLLTVTQVLARLRYNREDLFSLLGGRKMLLESPLIQELKEEFQDETRRDDTLRLLQIRFGTVPPVIEADLRAVRGSSALNALFTAAATCASLDEFCRHLPRSHG